MPWWELRAFLAGCATVAAIAALVGCGAGGVPDRPITTASAPAPAATSPSAYQHRLTQLDQRLGSALARVDRSRDPDALEQSLLAAAAAASAEGERMRAEPGDASVAEANAALTEGLGQFGGELGLLSQRVHDQEICTGPAAVDSIATAPSIAALRAIAGGLASPGADGRSYRWGASLPPAPHDQSQRASALANGTVLLDRRAPGQGDGVLEVRNEGADTAVAMLAKSGFVLVSAAVAPGNAVTESGIPDGDYTVTYTSGRDWDAGLGAFSRGCRFRRFTAPAPFRTGPAAGGVTYTVHSVVIGPGPANATIADIPAADLPH